MELFILGELGKGDVMQTIQQLADLLRPVGVVVLGGEVVLVGEGFNTKVLRVFKEEVDREAVAIDGPSGPMSLS